MTTCGGFTLIELILTACLFTAIQQVWKADHESSP